MAKQVKEAAVPVVTAGVCKYNAGLGCAEQCGCAFCGWNPHSEIRQRRIDAAMADRDAKLRSGEIHL